MREVLRLLLPLHDDDILQPIPHDLCKMEVAGSVTFLRTRLDHADAHLPARRGCISLSGVRERGTLLPMMWRR